MRKRKTNKQKPVDITPSTIMAINEMRLAFIEKEIETIYHQGGFRAVALFFVRNY